MKNPRKHPSTGYNRRRAAQKRILNSELGTLFKSKLSKADKRALLLNGWSHACFVGVQLSGTRTYA